MPSPYASELAAYLVFKAFHDTEESFSGSSLKRLLGYLPPYKGIIALSIFFMVSAGAASSLIAWLLGKLTDVGFYNQAAWIIVAAPLGLIGVSFLHGGSMFYEQLSARESQPVRIRHTASADVSSVAAVAFCCLSEQLHRCHHVQICV